MSTLFCSFKKTIRRLHCFAFTTTETVFRPLSQLLRPYLHERLLNFPVKRYQRFALFYKPYLLPSHKKTETSLQLLAKSTVQKSDNIDYVFIFNFLRAGVADTPHKNA